MGRRLHSHRPRRGRRKACGDVDMRAEEAGRLARGPRAEIVALDPSRHPLRSLPEEIVSAHGKAMCLRPLEDVIEVTKVEGSAVRADLLPLQFRLGHHEAACSEPGAAAAGDDPARVTIPAVTAPSVIARLWRRVTISRYAARWSSGRLNWGQPSVQTRPARPPFACRCSTCGRFRG